MHTHDNASSAQAAPGPVLDAETALRIGLRAIEECFGRATLEKYMPYRAVSVHKEWLVLGNNDLDGSIAKLQEAAGPDSFVSVRGGGGAPDASISAEDGRVLSVGRGR